MRSRWLLRRLCCLGLGVAMLAAGAGAALGRTPRFSRPPLVKVEVETSRRTRPPGAGAVRAPRRSPLTAEEAIEPERSLLVPDDGQLPQLEAAIKAAEHDDVATRADLYLRVALIHGERSRLARLMATEKLLEAQASPQHQAAYEKAARELEQRAARALEDAREAYLRLTEDSTFKTYGRMDFALASLALLLRGGNRLKEALPVYRNLLTSYPMSKYVPAAHLAFADDLFAEHELAGARAGYLKVLALPRSDVSAFARYMMGWVELGRGKPRAAAARFLTVLRDTARQRRQAVLNRAAQEDFVRAFSQFGAVKQAWPTFERSSPEGAQAMLELLADLYLEQGEHQLAVQALRTLVQRASGSPRACGWQVRVVLGTLALPAASPASKADELERLLGLSGALREGGGVTPAEVAACRADAAALTGEMARVFHDESLHSRETATMAAADRLYGAYLGAFPDAPDRARTEQLHAELLWSRAEREVDRRREVALWQRTAQAFTAVAGRGELDARLREEAATAADLARQNAAAIGAR